MSLGHGHGAVPAALGIAEDGGKAGGPAVHGRPGRPSDGFLGVGLQLGWKRMMGIQGGDIYFSHGVMLVVSP